LTRDSNAKAALIVGARCKEYVSEALLAGARENKNKRFVFSISVSSRQSISAQLRSFLPPGVQRYKIPSCSPEDLPGKLENLINNIRQENRINLFDVLLIDGSELSSPIPISTILAKHLAYGGRVFLDDINGLYGQRNYDQLRTDPSFFLLLDNLDVRNGWAVFQKESENGHVGQATPLSMSRH
jgi:hypothetical protein